MHEVGVRKADPQTSTYHSIIWIRIPTYAKPQKNSISIPTGTVSQPNKKSKEHEQILKDNFTEEVLKGWMIPFNSFIVYRIKVANIKPLGISDLFTIDESEKLKCKSGLHMIVRG